MMLYTMDNPPNWLKNLPAGAQEIGIAIFNKVLKESDDEEKARWAAWSAIKEKYRKEGDKWVEINEKKEVITLTWIHTLRF